MSAPDLTFRISDVRVEVHCERAASVAALAAIWAGAVDGPFPATRSAVFRVIRRDTGWDVVHGDGEEGHADSPIDIAPVVEAAVYRCLLRWHLPPRVILHAGCVVINGMPVVFLGSSGAGKSSLSRAAVQRGARYVTDDLAVTDGELLWGIARAIQFDPIPADEPSPEWLGTVDLRSYPLRLAGDRLGHLPILPVSPAAMCFAPQRVDRALLVLPRRAPATRLEELPYLEGLSALHAGAIGSLHSNLGSFVGPRRVWRLEWRTPEEAIELLQSRALLPN